MADTLAHLHRDEQRIAAALQELTEEARPLSAIDALKAIGWVEQHLGLKLAASQRAAYATKVQFNGNLMVGNAYTAQLGLKPGDEFEMKLGASRFS